MDGITIDDLRSVFGNSIENLNVNAKGINNSLREFKSIFKDILVSLNEFKSVAASGQKSKTEVEFVRDDKKALKGIANTLKENTDIIKAQMKQDKDAQQKSKSWLSKLLGPVAVVLTTVAALGFGLTKFPALKSFISNTGGNLMGNIFNLSKSLGNKEATLKQWLKNIPIVGFFVHVYDAFAAFAKGQYEKGLRELAFNFPGIDFIAPIFGTSRARLNVLAKDKATRIGEAKTGIFGINFEQGIDNLIGSLDEKMNNIFGFLNNAKQLVFDMFVAITKGDYKSISTALSSLSNLFPSLTGPAEFLKGLVGKQFFITATRTEGKTFEEINFVDVVKDLYSRIATNVGDLFNSILTPIQNIFKSLGLIFSGNFSKQKAGLAMLSVYFPSLTDGIKVMLAVTDKMSELKAKSKDGKISISDLLIQGAFGTIDTSKYDVAEPQELLDQKEALRKQIQSVSDKLNDRKLLENRRKALQDQIKRLNEEKTVLEQSTTRPRDVSEEKSVRYNPKTGKYEDTGRFGVKTPDQDLRYTNVLKMLRDTGNDLTDLNKKLTTIPTIEESNENLKRAEELLRRTEINRANIRLNEINNLQELKEAGINVEGVLASGGGNLTSQIIDKVSNAYSKGFTSDTRPSNEIMARSREQVIIQEAMQQQGKQNNDLQKKQLKNMEDIKGVMENGFDKVLQSVAALLKNKDVPQNTNNIINNFSNKMVKVSPSTQGLRPSTNT